MSEETITIKIKMTSNAKVYSITVNKTCTVEELKQACEKETSIPVESQNLVFKGRILENSKKIDEYNVQNDNTIILVKKASQVKKDEPKQETQNQNQNQNTSNNENQTQNTNSNTNNSNTNNNPNPNMNMNNPFGMNLNNMFQGLGGMGGLDGGLGMGGMNPQMMSQILNNPMYMQMMQNLMSDPNTMNMLMNQPQIKALIDSNPMMREIFSNPELLRQMFSPEMMQNMSAMLNSGGFGNMGMNPFGMGMGMGMPNMGMGNNNNNNSNPNNNNNNNNTTRMPNMNPYANLFNNMNMNMGMMNMGNFGQGNTNNNPQDNVDPKEKYKDQLAQLKDMGFINEEANIQVLKQCDGNVQFAIEKLLNMLK